MNSTSSNFLTGIGAKMAKITPLQEYESSINHLASIISTGDTLAVKTITASPNSVIPLTVVANNTAFNCHMKQEPVTSYEYVAQSTEAGVSAFLNKILEAISQEEKSKEVTDFLSHYLPPKTTLETIFKELKLSLTSFTTLEKVNEIAEHTFNPTTDTVTVDSAYITGQACSILTNSGIYAFAANYISGFFLYVMVSYFDALKAFSLNMALSVINRLPDVVKAENQSKNYLISLIIIVVFFVIVIIILIILLLVR